MVSEDGDRLYEFLALTSKSGLLDTALEGFKAFIPKTEEAASAAGLDPALAHPIYHYGDPNEAVILAIWRSKDHHDQLGANANFEPAQRFLVENIIPNLKQPPQPFYVPLPREHIYFDLEGEYETPCIDLIELELIQAHKKASIAGKLEALFSDVKQQNKNFGGWFYGYPGKVGENTHIAIGVRWNLQRSEQNYQQDDVYDGVSEALKGAGQVTRRRVLFIR